MSTIDRGKKITITFKERGPSGRATLVIDVAADDDILPHEHREDMRSIAAAILQVPVTALEAGPAKIASVKPTKRIRMSGSPSSTNTAASTPCVITAVTGTPRLLWTASLAGSARLAAIAAYTRGPAMIIALTAEISASE